jgi:hypothetical protein
MALNDFASRMLHYSAAPFEFMRAETKPPGGLPAGGGAVGDQGFVISPELPAVLDNIVISRTLGGSASEQSVKFPGWALPRKGLAGARESFRACFTPLSPARRSTHSAVSSENSGLRWATPRQASGHHGPATAARIGLRLIAGRNVASHGEWTRRRFNERWSGLTPRR